MHACGGIGYGGSDYLIGSYVGQISAANPRMSAKAVVVKATELVAEVEKQFAARDKKEAAEQKKQKAAEEKVWKAYTKALAKDQKIKRFKNIVSKQECKFRNMKDEPKSRNVLSTQGKRVDKARRAVSKATDAFRKAYAKKHKVVVNILY